MKPTEEKNRIEVCNLFFDRLDQKMIGFVSLETGSTKGKHVDQIRPRKNVSIAFGPSFFDQETFWPRKQTFRLCSTKENVSKEKNLNYIWPSKNVLAKFDEGKHFDTEFFLTE